MKKILSFLVIFLVLILVQNVFAQDIFITTHSKNLWDDNLTVLKKKLPKDSFVILEDRWNPNDKIDSFVYIRCYLPNNSTVSGWTEKSGLGYKNLEGHKYVVPSYLKKLHFYFYSKGKMVKIKGKELRIYKIGGKLIRVVSDFKKDKIRVQGRVEMNGIFFYYLGSGPKPGVTDLFIEVNNFK